MKLLVLAVAMTALVVEMASAQVRAPIRPPAPPAPVVKPPTPAPTPPKLVPAQPLVVKPNPVAPALRPTPQAVLPTVNVQKPTPSPLKPTPNTPSATPKPTPTLVPAKNLNAKTNPLHGHHMWPKSMGSQLPYRSGELTRIGNVSHRQLHSAMKQYFSNPKDTRFWRVDPKTGRNVNIYSTKGQKLFSVAERAKALDGFYRGFQKGKFLDSFRREMGQLNQSKKLK